MDVLVTAEELSAMLAADQRVVLLDVRWSLGGPPGRDDYLAGHLPGAIFVDLSTELAGCGQSTDGRHPLPTIDALQASARRWGVNSGDRVVAYDATGNMAAARAWWLLRWGGIDNVRLLDGGVQAWAAEGGALATNEVNPEAGDIELMADSVPTIDMADAVSFGGVLLDARAGERFRGETEPIDPKAGHIPGAVSAPTTENTGTDGCFLAPDALRQRFEALGVHHGTPVAAYCGSGITAAHEVAALAIAGFDAALYPGSWS